MDLESEKQTISDGIILRICRGHTCGKQAEAIVAAARRYVRAHGLEDEVGIAYQPCFGRCFSGPNILVEHWEQGKPNLVAIKRLMFGRESDAARFERGVEAGDISGLIRYHLGVWRNSRQDVQPA